MCFSIRRDPEITQFNYEMFNPEIFAEAGCSSPKVQRTSEILPIIAQFLSDTGITVQIKTKSYGDLE